MRSHLENSEWAEKPKNGLMSRIALGYSLFNVKQVTKNVSILKMPEKSPDKLKTRKNKLVVSLSEHPELVLDTKEAIEVVKMEIIENQLELEKAKDLQKDLVEFVKFALTTIQNLPKSGGTRTGRQIKV